MQVMQNPKHKLRQSSTIKNGELWQAPTTIESNNFRWNFAHVSYLTIATKGCSEFFFILFRSWVINKNVKNECVETRVFFIFASNSRSLDIVKQETCAKFQQKILIRRKHVRRFSKQILVRRKPVPSFSKKILVRKKTCGKLQ